MSRPFTVIDCAQREPEWWAARLGRLTGSRAADMLAKIKSGEAAGRRNLRVQLVCERLTQLEQGPDFHSEYMERGQERETDALARFEAVTGEIVSFAGFVSHDDHMAGCSPDGYLGDFEDIVEAKCPKAAIHLGYITSGTVPGKYVAQLRHNLWITGAQRAHFVSYSPNFPAALQLHIVTMARAELDIDEYEEEALRFLREVDAEVEAVMELAERAEAVHA